MSIVKKISENSLSQSLQFWCYQINCQSFCKSNWFEVVSNRRLQLSTFFYLLNMRCFCLFGVFFFLLRLFFDLLLHATNAYRTTNDVIALQIENYFVVERKPERIDRSKIFFVFFCLQGTSRRRKNKMKTLTIQQRNWRKIIYLIWASWQSDIKEQIAVEFKRQHSPQATNIFIYTPFFFEVDISQSFSLIFFPFVIFIFCIIILNPKLNGIFGIEIFMDKLLQIGNKENTDKKKVNNPDKYVQRHINLDQSW